jgi:hypothetical protein
MKQAICKLESASPYSASRAHETPKLNKELPDAYEERTWREKAHFDPVNLEVFIPPMSFKQSLDAAAQLLGVQIAGKGKSTYTKRFGSGVLVMDPVYLGLKRDETIKGRYHCNSDGVRGSGKRVWRIFPEVHKWKAEVTFHILDDIITESIFRDHLVAAGAFIGVGRFRPQNKGFYGKFKVAAVKWMEVS